MFRYGPCVARRVQGLSGLNALPMRRPEGLLLGAAPAAAPAGGGPADRPDDGAVPQGRARRRPHPRRAARPAHHAARARAAGAPAPCRVGHRADRPRGGRHRPGHRGADRPEHREPTASRAGVPCLSRHPAAAAHPWARAAGGGLRPRPRPRAVPEAGHGRLPGTRRTKVRPAAHGAEAPNGARRRCGEAKPRGSGHCPDRRPAFEAHEGGTFLRLV